VTAASTKPQRSALDLPVEKRPRWQLIDAH